MEWKFRKGDYTVIVTTTMVGGLKVQVTDTIKTYADLVKDKSMCGLEFTKPLKLERNGSICLVPGFTITEQMYNEMLEETTRIKSECDKEREEQKRQQELEEKQLYADYKSGKRPIELVQDVDSEFWAITIYNPKNNVAYELLNELKCIKYNRALADELVDKIDKNTMTINILDCIAYFNKIKADELAKQQKRKQEELQKPKIQHFTEELESGVNAIYNSNVGDIITRGYCKYRVTDVTPDCDYPNLIHITCERLDEAI